MTKGVQNDLEAIGVQQRALEEAVAAYWPIELGSLRLVKEGINAVFRYEYRGVGRFLRLADETVRPATLVVAASDFLHHLGKHKAPVCASLPTTRGELLAYLPWRQQQRLAQVLPQLPGSQLAGVHLTASMCRAWGRAVALVHQASQRFVGHPALPTWQTSWAQVGHWLAAAPADLRELHRRLGDWLEALPQRPGDLGVVHGDCWRANAVWQAPNVCLADFDAPMVHWWVCDVAMALGDLGGLPRADTEALQASFLTGYQGERALAADWLADWPLFLACQELSMYGFVSARWPLATAPNGQAREIWLAEMRCRALSRGAPPKPF